MEIIKIKFRLLFFLLAATITLTVLSGCFDMGKLTAATQDLPSLGAPSSSSAVKLFISATNSSNSLNTCLPLALSSVNSSDDPANVANTTTVSLSGAGLGVFYSNSNCTTSTSAVNIEAGTSSTNFYFKTTSSGSYLFMATANSLTLGTYSLTLNSGALTNPQTLALKINGSTSINNGCSPYMLLNVDSLGFAANVSGNLTLTLGGGGAGQFYSDYACTTTITTATINSGLSFIVVYYKNLTVQSILMAVDAPTYATAFLPVNVSAGATSSTATRLVLVGAPNIQTDACAAFSVMTADSSGSIKAATANASVNLAGSGSGLFYSDSSCVTSTTAVTITSGTSLKTFYYKSSATENLIFTSQSSTLESAALPVSVNTNTAGSTNSLGLKISGASAVSSNECTSYALLSVNALGNAVNATSNLALTIGGAGTGQFYSDNACTTATTTATINSGASYVFVYYKNTSAQSIVMTAEATAYATAFLPVNIASGAVSSAATHLVLMGTPSLQTGSCAAFSAVTTDNSGGVLAVTTNTTVNLAGNGGGSFYADNSCVTSTTAVTITSGTSLKTFYFKSSTAENLVLTA